MNIQVFSVFDLKSKVFGQPFYSHNSAVAQRSFSIAVNDSSTGLFKHPEDFVLFHIGTFDDEKGDFSSFAPVNLGLAAHFKGV